MNKYLRSGINAVGVTLVIVIFTLFLNFIILNLILGCETWEKEYWNENNSCVTPLQMARQLFLP